ncbi:hypothetical protein RJ640_027840 [Escallonia rubra]|uniref:Uncharacterized protein n=1 Tax=Escallonia rubra TaxID=112253 RepID=A0AA88UNT7_9ASTE|nr:hypothetical protein RJ640_027840 [Escallonia rubra]
MIELTSIPSQLLGDCNCMYDRYAFPEQWKFIAETEYDWDGSSVELEKMFKKAALVLIDRLNTDSKPFSITSTRASSTSNLLCAISIFSSSIEPHLHTVHSAASTLSNSFRLSSWFSHAAPLDINFETTDHRPGLFFKTGTDKNSKRDWKIEMLTALTSLRSELNDAAFDAQLSLSSSQGGLKISDIDLRAKSTLPASFMIPWPFPEATDLVSINFEINDHPLGFVIEDGTDTNNRSDRNTEMVIEVLGDFLLHSLSEAKVSAYVVINARITTLPT